jgi:monovalent cation:H+ antiporter, CPA1 family
MLNLFLFFLLGVATGRHEFFITAGSIAGVIVILVLSRMLIVYSGGLALRLLRIRLPLAWQHVMMLGGLRGEFLQH